MVDQASPLYGKHAQHSLAGNRSASSFHAWAPPTFLVLACVLQLSTASAWGRQEIAAPHLSYSAFNFTCTVLVVASAWEARGQLRLRLTRSLNLALFLHGILAFSVLLMRLQFSRSAMLIGLASSLLGAVITVFLREQAVGPRVGIIPDATEPLMVNGAEIAASPHTDLRRYDVILTPMNAPLSVEWSAALSRAMLSGTQLRHVAEYLEEARGQTYLRHFHIDHLSDRAGLYAGVKRAGDLATTIFFLPFTLPLMILTAGLVLVLMGRPVLFVQERIGLGGRPFRMLKFRTMARGISEQGAATSTADMRVTPLGRILRRYRLDELPQFLNIVRGDMSLIGPRPEWTVLHEDYVRQEPAYVYRNLVRPGITGWAQIRSGYASTVAETRVKLSFDLYYVKNVSLGLDLQIVVRTVWALVTGYGAR